MDTATVKENTKFYNTKLPPDIIFTKYYTSTSDEYVGKLTREVNIQYRACISLLIYLLSTRVDFSFVVHKLSKFSANPGKVQFEGLVHIFRYIRDNKTLGLKYYTNINDAPVSGLLRQASIKTENHMMDFSDFICQDCTDTGRSTGSFIIFIKVGQLNMAHVSGPYYQSSAESEYDAACTGGMDLAHLRMLIS